MHNKQALLLYTSLSERLSIKSQANKASCLDALETVDPIVTAKCSSCHTLSRKNLEKFMNPDSELLHDDFIIWYLDNASIYQQKELFVIDAYLEARVLSLSTIECRVC